MENDNTAAKLILEWEAQKCLRWASISGGWLLHYYQSNDESYSEAVLFVEDASHAWDWQTQTWEQLSSNSPFPESRYREHRLIRIKAPGGWVILKTSGKHNLAVTVCTTFVREP